MIIKTATSRLRDHLLSAAALSVRVRDRQIASLQQRVRELEASRATVEADVHNGMSYSIREKIHVIADRVAGLRPTNDPKGFSERRSQIVHDLRSLTHEAPQHEKIRSWKAPVE